MSTIYHSVGLQESSCKGCTVCVTACPVEAIRVHNGKAHILEKQCIDCGECIRQCPNRAKYATSAELSELKKYTHTVALASPAWYAQFDEKYPRRAIRAALQSLGFSAVYDVADAAAEITKATASYMFDFLNQSKPERPVISSSCPAVVKLIQIRFPTLINHVLPLIPPAELAARTVRSSCPAGETMGIFFISPCPAKMTLASSPLGHKKSEIDGAFGFGTLYLPVLSAIKTLPSHILNPELPSETSAAKKRSQIWCTASGEAECLESALHQIYTAANKEDTFKWMNVSGIPQTLKILSSIEDGVLSSFDFIEIDACSGGCLGGALTIQQAPVAESAMRRRIRSQNKDDTAANDLFAGDNGAAADYVPHLWDDPLLPRPVRLLSADFTKARKMMQEIEDTLEQLPGLDCGCCGAPNCRALAEDIVRHNAHIEDCVTILKARYEEMLFGKKRP